MAAEVARVKRGDLDIILTFCNIPWFRESPVIIIAA